MALNIEISHIEIKEQLDRLAMENEETYYTEKM